MGISAVWQRAHLLLDRPPFYPVMRPLAGLMIGAVGGALYGALCGGLHALLRGEPRLFLAWFLPTAGAGATAGLVMGIYAALDRAGQGAPAPLGHRDAWLAASDEAEPASVPVRSRHDRPTYQSSRN
jgi:hypothetical protein